MPVLAVVGPTAVGKSALALALAERLDGEIVNADAMQLYRGMDIGTAKTPARERHGIPHHQLDVLDVRDEAAVAAYQREARRDIAGIRERGRLPILVGGSGLYVRAVLDRLTIPPTDPTVRAIIESQLRSDGPAALYARLVTLDAAAAAAILPANTRRVVRALEVVELTGLPFSATLPTREFASPAFMLGLELSRAELDARIDARTALMWSDGLVEEAQRLVRAGLREGRTAGRALGYRQALAVLDGEMGDAQAVTETAQATRRLARRQQSWFRPDPRICWMDADAAGLVDRAVALIGPRLRALGGTMGSDD